MTDQDELNLILDRLLKDGYSDIDIEKLRQSLQVQGTVVQYASQKGKFNTNIGEIRGGTFHIGDVHSGADTKAIEEIFQKTLKGLINKPNTAVIPDNLPRSGAVEFVGREIELERLHKGLLQDSFAVNAIAGMGGVGKTELALQYALQYKQFYSGGICWVQARGVDVGTQIVQFARSRLQINPSEDLEVLAQVGFCWSHWNLGDVLIVIDDVVDYSLVKPYLPPAETRFKVLLTTRLRVGRSVKQIEVQVLEQDFALELMRSLAGATRIDNERKESEELCAWLGYLPLGLELVGRHLDRKPDLSIKDIQKRLNKKRLEERALRKADADMTKAVGVSAAFNLSWDTLDHPTKELACLLSLFGPAPIPWEIVEQIDSDEDPDDLEDVRDDNLVNLHLLQRKAEGSYQLHQLVREFLQEKQSNLTEVDQQKELFCNTIVMIAQKIPESPTRQLILEVSPAVPHIAEVADNLNSYLRDKDLVAPFEGLGRFYESQGFYEQAELWAKQSNLRTQERFGESHIEVARSLSNLANIYQFQGRYEDAEQLFNEALELRKTILGTEDANFADSLNSLAVLACKQGRYECAEDYLNQALKIWEQCYGVEHAHIADGLNNLGLLYNDLGRYEEAEPILLRALEMRKKILGLDHPRITTSLNNLACCYNAQEKYEAAEPLFKEALHSAKNSMGEKHPRIPEYQNNLGNLYLNQERYDDAEPLLSEALEVQRKILGPEHPNVAMGLHNLAYLYYLQGRYEESEPIYLDSLGMRQRLLGEKHPLVAISFNNLATLYREQENFEQAKDLFRKAVEILQIELGLEHPLTLQIQSNLEKIS